MDLINLTQNCHNIQQYIKYPDYSTVYNNLILYYIIDKQSFLSKFSIIFVRTRTCINIRGLIIIYPRNNSAGRKIARFSLFKWKKELYVNGLITFYYVERFTTSDNAVGRNRFPITRLLIKPTSIAARKLRLVATTKT